MANNQIIMAEDVLSNLGLSIKYNHCKIIKTRSINDDKYVILLIFQRCLYHRRTHGYLRGLCWLRASDEWKLWTRVEFMENNILEIPVSDTFNPIFRSLQFSNLVTALRVLYKFVHSTKGFISRRTNITEQIYNLSWYSS